MSLRLEETLSRIETPQPGMDQRTTYSWEIRNASSRAEAQRIIGS
jgi:hypothetical protein